MPGGGRPRVLQRLLRDHASETDTVRTPADAATGLRVGLAKALTVPPSRDPFGQRLTSSLQRLILRPTEGAQYLQIRERRGAMMVDTGDTAWVLTAAALVMFMTPGLALFYGGLCGEERARHRDAVAHRARRRHGPVGLVGYSVAFGRRRHGDRGPAPGPAWWSAARASAPTVPASAFMVPADVRVITPRHHRRVAERMRFGGYCLPLNVVGWCMPVAHWGGVAGSSPRHRRTRLRRGASCT